MAITGVPPNVPEGGLPTGHHMDFHWFTSVSGTGPPYCVEETIQFGLCDGPCYSNSQNQTGQLANGYGAQWPLALSGTSGGAGYTNSWGYVNGGLTIDFQLRDANGIGVLYHWGIILPSTSSGLPGMTYTIAVSPLSNPNPGFTDSGIYRLTQGGNWGALWGGTSGLWEVGRYSVPFGNYTYKIWDASGDCYHSNSPTVWTPGPNQNPSNHSIPIGQSNTPGNTFVQPITITDSPGSIIQTGWNGQGWSGCGPQPLTPQWHCGGDYQCLEILPGTEDQLVDGILGTGANIWNTNANFGWTKSTSQAPPNGETNIEPYQGVSLTASGQPFDGMLGINQGGTTTLMDIWAALPAQIPEMPVNPVSNWWITSNGYPSGGATTYNLAAPQMIWTWDPSANNGAGAYVNSTSTVPPIWNPPAGAVSGPCSPPTLGCTTPTEGQTSLRGIRLPPTGSPPGAPPMLNPQGFNNPLRSYNPIHATLSDCLACCGAQSNQYDQNGIQNPYYGPWITPNGWNSSTNPVQSNNLDFVAYLNGANPFGFQFLDASGHWIDSSQAGFALSTFKVHMGANMCGAFWL